MITHTQAFLMQIIIMKVLRSPATQKGIKLCLSFIQCDWFREPYLHSKPINVLAFTLGNSFSLFLTKDCAHKNYENVEKFAMVGRGSSGNILGQYFSKCDHRSPRLSQRFLISDANKCRPTSEILQVGSVPSP